MLVRSLTHAKPGQTISMVKLELEGEPVTAAWRPLDDGIVVRLVVEKEATLKVALDV
jgi:hypothetical protein